MIKITKETLDAMSESERDSLIGKRGIIIDDKTISGFKIGAKIIVKAYGGSGYLLCLDLETPHTKYVDPSDIQFSDEYPKIMRVHNGKPEQAVKRVVLMEKLGGYISWAKAETHEQAELAKGTAYWGFAEEIKAPLEVTMQEVCKAFGVREVKIVEK